MKAKKIRAEDLALAWASSLALELQEKINSTIKSLMWSYTENAEYRQVEKLKKIVVATIVDRLK